jgi:hypothetical protein
MMMSGMRLTVTSVCAPSLLFSVHVTSSAWPPAAST